MSNLLNVGSRALLANEVALQTIGHNIANSSTVGYSRQDSVAAARTFFVQQQAAMKHLVNELGVQPQ